MSRGRLPALDGMRALAALAVVLVHCGIGEFGWAGVDAFFVLSGLLITGILLDAKAAGARGWREYGRPFYARRALRILPLAYLGLVLAFVLVPALQASLAPDSALRAWLFGPTPIAQQAWWWTYLANFYVDERALGTNMVRHYWSLGVEEQFYLLWPWIVLLCSPRRLTWVALGMLIAAPLSRVLVLWAIHRHWIPPDDTNSYQFATPLRMDGLAAGVLIALGLRAPGGLARWTRWAGLALVAGIVLIALDRWPLRFTGLALLFGSIVTWVLARPSGLVARLLSTPSLAWIGSVSYAVYLIHRPIALQLRLHEIGPWTNLFVTLAITLPLAAVSWRFFEAPILRKKSRWPMPGG